MTTLNASETSLIVLRGGLSVPVDALRLLLDLEERGCVIRLDGDGLLIGPREKITARDRVAIVEHREHLRELVRYCEKTVQ